MNKASFFILAACLLATSRVHADPAQTPNAHVNFGFGTLLDSGASVTPLGDFGPIDSIDTSDYHAYHFYLPNDVQHGDGSYLNIQTFFEQVDNDPMGTVGFGVPVDSVIGLYDSNGDLLVDDDDGNHVEGDPIRERYSMLTFGNFDPLAENPTRGAFPDEVEAGSDSNGLTDRRLPAGSYTLVLAPFDDQSGLLPVVGGYAHLPSTLSVMDAAGGLLEGDFGDFVLQITHHGPTFQRGDFNMSGAVDAVDIDLLATNEGNTTDPKFDLDGDGTATFAYNASGINSDSDELIRTILETEYGDANLSGNVSIGDLSLLAQHFGQTGVGWRDGDFNGDGRASIGDLSILAQKFGYSGASAASTVQVPEPCSQLLALIASLTMACRAFGTRRSRSSS